MLRTMRILILAVAVPLLLASPALSVTEIPKTVKAISSVEVTPTVGAYIFSAGQSLHNTALYGVRLGYNIIGTTMADTLGVEANVNYFNTTATSGGKADGLVFGTDLVYSFYPRKGVVPFVVLGAGGLLIDRNASQDNSPYFNYGFGVKYFLKNRLALRMDARQLFVYNNVATRNNFEVTAGLTYAFSDLVRIIPPAPPKPKPVTNAKPVPELKDSDMQPETQPAAQPEAQPEAPPAAPPEAQPEAQPVPPEGEKLAEKTEAVATGEAKPEILGALQPVEETPAPAAAPVPAPMQQREPVPAAAKKAPAPAAAPALRKPEGKPVIYLTIEFDFNSASVRPEYLKQIKELSALIKASPEATALVEGHTDSVGKSAANLRLSLLRAENVKKLLVKYGVKSEKVTAKGYGVSKPKASNNTSKGRQLNRRADAITVVIDDGGNTAAKQSSLRTPPEQPAGDGH